MILNVALVGALSSLAVAAPLQSRNEGSKTSCNNPETRVEWRNLSADQQQSYLDAVLCLKKKPSSIGLDTSLYDDFPYVHSTLNANSTFSFSAGRCLLLTDSSSQFISLLHFSPGTATLFTYTPSPSMTADIQVPRRFGTGLSIPTPSPLRPSGRPLMALVEMAAPTVPRTSLVPLNASTTDRWPTCVQRTTRNAHGAGLVRWSTV